MVNNMSVHTGRFRVLDCWISRQTMDSALHAVEELRANGAGGYVCFSNVHTVVTSRKDLRLRAATNNAAYAMPDGKPLSLLGRFAGESGLGQVAGPDFMPAVLRRGGRHFLFGSTKETLERLERRLAQDYPRAVVVGRLSPSVWPFSPEEQQEITAAIRAAQPDWVWVALGAPKQEYWMAEHWQSLAPSILLGVGAAFDFHAGMVRRAPRWTQRLCLEWLFRFLQEPRRLWKRYAVTNSLFMLYLFGDVLTGKRFRRGDGRGQ